MKNIAVLTAFGDFDPQYSLCNIVLEQIKLLDLLNYKVKWVVMDSFDPDKLGVKFNNVEFCKLPMFLFSTGVENMELITKKFKEFLKDVDVCFTHDLMFIDTFLIFNMAIRATGQTYPNIRWLHWLHSGPSPQPTGMKEDNLHRFRYQNMPNSYWIAMNYTDLPYVAKMLHTPEGYIRVVYNPVSVQDFFGMHPLSRQIISDHKLLDCDVLMVYPLDTTRFSGGKGGNKIIPLINAFKRMGVNAKMVFCNAWANAPQQQQLVKNLSGESVIFTSTYVGYELGVPHQVVRDLMVISNVFVLPSLSEGCSLILLEAGLTKNLVILNEDSPSTKEFGEDKTLYMKWSGQQYGKMFTTAYNPNYDSYCDDWAKKIITELDNNKALTFNRKVLKNFNMYRIWKEQLEPLVEG